VFRGDQTKDVGGVFIPVGGCFPQYFRCIAYSPGDLQHRLGGQTRGLGVSRDSACRVLALGAQLIPRVVL
jgi:hypothetical protein